MRRFYKEAATIELAGGFGVALDAKPMKTPVRQPLLVPAAGLANAIADEWNAQGETIGREAMRLTRLACTAIDVTDGAFVVWDRNSGAPLGRAVASSCAVPGIVSPVTINGRRYMDGGIGSTTNATIANGYERVLVVAVIRPGSGAASSTMPELAARAIHDASSRRYQRFVAINCSAIPETLLEGELFGRVRGAFTGAVANRQGRIEQAHRGTLFLDEVGTMSAALQAKLLRVIQAREFERVGDSQTIKVDVRVIAATNSDLRKMVEMGAFREDLYYRLNVIPVRMPALRERRADIPILAQHFLEELAKSAVPPRARVTLGQDAQQALMAFGWPGNVRQLENVMERTFALSPGRVQIGAVDLPDEIRQARAPVPSADFVFPDVGIQMDRLVSDFEHDLIRRALERTGGNKRQAAELLNVKRTTLIEKLKRLERN